MRMIKDIIKLIVFLAGLTLLLNLIGCNPVKKVLRDPEKFDIVVTEVIKRGYCVNDTTIISKSDTLITYDTITHYFVDTQTIKDTVYKTNNIRIYTTKTITIRDTIKSVVVDNARIKLLQADSASLRQEVIKYKQKASERLNWLLFAIILIGLYFFLKYKP